MPRVDGRGSQQMRAAKITRGFMPNAEGSCLIEMGNTKVICTASVEDKIPPFRKMEGLQGWLTAEYGMLPRATNTRTQRETKGRGRADDGDPAADRAQPAHRRRDAACSATGRSGSTATCCRRTAARAAPPSPARMSRLRKPAANWLRGRQINRMPLTGMVAAISVGVVGSDELLDLCYEEDHKCAVDMNIIATDKGRYIEVQGTGETAPFDRARLNRLLDLAQIGLDELFRLQKAALDRRFFERSWPEAS